MAELNIAVNEGRRAGVRHRPRHKLKIDMTPMVDLGFLLITFFIFTTELTQPKTMNLIMPHDGPVMPSAESKTMTILVASGNKLFYYFGTEDEAIKMNFVYPTSYSEMNGIGKIIRDKQNKLSRAGVDKKELMVVIKPDKSSSYENVVNVLDEMTINGITRYAVVKPGDKDKEFLSKN